MDLSNPSLIRLLGFLNEQLADIVISRVRGDEIAKTNLCYPTFWRKKCQLQSMTVILRGQCFLRYSETRLDCKV